MRYADAVHTLAENAHGWDVQVVVAFYPGRARDVPLTDASRQSFCQAAAHLVLAYPQISSIIIGNEPNSSAYWQPQFNADGTPASPQAYFQTAALCYDLLHAARPAINVVGPATSSNGNDNPHATTHAGLSPGSFIAALGKAYRASGRKTPIFDTIDHHPVPAHRCRAAVEEARGQARDRRGRSQRGSSPRTKARSPAPRSRLPAAASRAAASRSGTRRTASRRSPTRRTRASTAARSRTRSRSRPTARRRPARFPPPARALRARRSSFATRSRSPPASRT